MEKALITALIASAVAQVPQVAHAQSSVLLYGLIDEGILFNSNARGGRQYAMNSGNLMGDRWGMKGTEDLGDGLQALFVLESGYNLNTGAFQQGGALFGRQAYVGFNGKFGRITFGRQYDSLLDGISPYTLANSYYHMPGMGQLSGTIGAHPGDLDNLDNSVRINNAIKYASPLRGGFQAVGQYSVGGVAGTPTRNQIWSLAGTYSNGPLSLGAAFESIRDPNYSFFGNQPSGSTTGLNITTPVYSGYASARSMQIAAAGGTYVFGNLGVGLVYSNTRFQDIGTEAGTNLNPNNIHGTATFNTGEINAGYQFTPFFTAGVGFHYTQGSPIDGLSRAKYSQFNIGADYLLSKRTDLYTVVVYQHAAGTDSTLKPAVASINGLSPSSNGKQVAVAMGIRTRF